MTYDRGALEIIQTNVHATRNRSPFIEAMSTSFRRCVPSSRVLRTLDRVFGALANRPYFPTTSQSRAEAVPLFLLPAFHKHGPTQRLSIRSQPFIRRPSRPCCPTRAHERFISTSPRRPAATVIANPRKDDDGNDMLVDITPRAAKACPLSLPLHPCSDSCFSA